MLKIVNRTVPMALKKSSATPVRRCRRCREVHRRKRHDQGALHLQEKHIAVFDCAFKPAQGQRSIQYMAHLKMMAAAQPFLSGAISKTVNMPQESTVEEIMHSYAEGWKLGLKAVAIYRDGSPERSASRSTRPKTTVPPKPRRKRKPPIRKPILSSPASSETRRGELQGLQAQASSARSASVAQLPGHAPGRDPQIRYRRPRRLYHRGPVRRWWCPANCSSPWRRKVRPSAG